MGSRFAVPLSALQMQDKRIEVKNSNRSRFLLKSELQSDPTIRFLIVMVQDVKTYFNFGNSFPLLYLTSLFNNTGNTDNAVSLKNTFDDRFPKFITCCINEVFLFGYQVDAVFWCFTKLGEKPFAIHLSPLLLQSYKTYSYSLQTLTSESSKFLYLCLGQLLHSLAVHF